MKKYENYDITIAITRRCNARCIMCSQWAISTKPDEEINLETLDKLPLCKFIQITGGEPFVRSDIQEIVALLRHKSKRVLINTNGYYTDKIISIARSYPDIAFRISIDGERETHNKIRGIDIYDRAIQTLEALKKAGVEDIGISFTLQESNYADLITVYHLALHMQVGFSCTVVHNSFYFDKDDNKIEHADSLRMQLHQLIQEQLNSKRKKDWAKAFFNDYNIRYMDGEPLAIQCDAGVTSFYIDALGTVLPCNMTPTPWVMGNLKEETWDEILQSNEARRVITRCKNCKTQCWSMCNVQTAIKKKFWIPAWWLMKNKFLGKYIKMR